MLATTLLLPGLCGVILALSPVLSSSAPAQDTVATKADKADKVAPIMIGAASYPWDRMWRQSSLWRYDMKPTAGEELAYLGKNPRATAFPRVAIAVVDALHDRPSDAKVSAVIYLAPSAAERTVGRMFQLVRHPDRGTALVVTGKSIPLHLWIEVYEVETRTETAAHPLTFDTKQVDKWPTAATPLATLHARWDADPVQIKTLTASVDGDDLLFRAAGASAKESVLYYRLKLRDKKWSRVRLEETPIESEP